MSGQIGFLACIVIPVLIIGSLSLHHSMVSIQKELAYLKQLEIENERKKQLEKVKKDINIHTETEEELKARLRAEIRKELGLDEGN